MTERVKAAKCASSDEVAVRLFAEEDSVQELTCLLHRAYADHAAAGRVFFASYQSSQDTAHRLRKGECWLALQETSLVGTVTVVTPYVAPEGYPAAGWCGVLLAAGGGSVSEGYWAGAFACRVPPARAAPTGRVRGSLPGRRC